MINILFLFLSFFALDLYFDRALGSSQTDLTLDLLLEAPRLVLFLSLFLMIWKTISPVAQVAPVLPAAPAQKIHWRSQLEGQFKDWTLSKSEGEVAEALLEGLSLKEIASKRFTSEKTIRNQCRNIYAKSGTTGRHELAAYFLKKSRR